MHLTRRHFLAVTAAAVTAPVAPSALARPVEGKPGEGKHEIRDAGYHVQFSHSTDDLIGDLNNTERGDPHRESQTPHRHWYSEHVRHEFGAWGPAARRYARLPDLEGRPIQWLRERVIATAARFLGYGYQHHHIPDWDPPSHWPWKHCCVGHNGRGVDCSNFTSFVYNQGFGIKCSSGIGEQSVAHSALEGNQERIRIRTIELPADYRKRQDVLKTGDLVYIRGKEGGHVTHVVLWIGSPGRSTSGVPLIMDSHGGGVVNDSGEHIACGIHLRPFRQGEWYDRCASHAHRVF